MASEKQTTVNLTEKAQEIKIDLAPVFGLKNILSAGLILLNELSDSDQKAMIQVASSLQLQTGAEQVSIRKVVQNVVARTKARQARLDGKKKGKSSKAG